MHTTIPNIYAEDKVALIDKMPVVKNKDLGLNEIRKDIWIADSGVSSQMTNDLHGLINQRKISLKVKIGSGEHVEGDLRGKDGTENPIF